MESQMGQRLVMRTPGWVIVVVMSLIRRVRRVSHGRLDDLTAKGCNQLKSIQGWTRHACREEVGFWAISLCIVLEMRRTLKGDVIGSLVNHASYDKMCMGMPLSVVDLMASWTRRPNAFPSMGPSSADRQFLFVRLHIREAGDESGRNTLTTINRDAVTYWSMWAPPCLASTREKEETSGKEEDGTMSSAARPSGACLKCLLVVFAVASALCVSGPALYWRFKKGFASTQSLSSSSHPGCAPCVCDCPPPLSLDAIAPGDLSFLLPFLFLSRIVHFLGSYYEFLMLP
ncbi:hypothetical protein B296_00025017 [Ensete ventricosum]|uniref:Uncharacterized protein n=1 Tax=Ensete ventricosum TaxID=4639 RepID=A0A427ATT9_ENSVE|nr:hypothetical protein B296_00025017 [Ensete ventricosum]